MDIKSKISLILASAFIITFIIWVYSFIINSNYRDGFILSIVLIIIGFIFRKNNNDFQ